MNYMGRAYAFVILIIALLFAILQLSGPAFHMLHIPPHISQFIWTIFIISGIVLLIFYLQPNRPSTLTTSHSGNVLKGSVTDYHTNRVGDIDKLVIATKTQKYWIHFPPHTAKEIMKRFTKGDTAEFVANRSGKRTIDNHDLYEFVSGRSSSSFFVAESIPAPAPAAGKKIEVTGKSGRYKLDEKGVVAGLIINNYLVDLPPHLVQNILPVIKESVDIIIKGYERNTDDGFVNVTGLTIIKPYAITIDKTDYLL